MSERGNFRPISILVILSKILERHVFNSYLLYLTEHEILSDYQHGFRPGHSCETSLNMIYEYLVNNIVNGEINGVLMLDFSKAFDLVDHNILLQKIHAYGATDLTLKWFASYLEGRTQQEQINEVLSEPLTIITGAPQGSILGPLLFLIFINDLPSFLTTSHPSLFADDSTLLAHGCELPDIKASLSTDLCITSNWARSNHMALNFSKTKFMKIYSKRKYSQLDYDSILYKDFWIEEITSGKLLGILLDNNLSWDNQVDKIYKYLNSRLYLFKRICPALPLKCRIKFYYAFIYPHLLYGITIWGNARNELIDPLLKLQKRAARLALDESMSTPSVNLFRKLEWIPIYNLIKMRKILLV
ncbi:Hypothetical predicted protein, partial [Paramuricea clavata]